MAQVQGLAQETSILFKAHVQSVRLFMRDFAELNLLIRGEESSDRMIAWATMDFLSDFNATPPNTALSLDSMYARSMQSFAIRGTVISLLQSLMLLYMRNQVPFSDGGLSVNMNDKAPIIQSALALFQSSYEQTKRLIKTEINVQQLLDVNSSGLHSDYTLLSGLGYY
jgi:hypothetical protein